MKTLNLFQLLKLRNIIYIRHTSSKAKYKLDDQIEQLYLDNKINPKKHSGICKNKQFDLPKWVIKIMDQNLYDVDRTQLYKDKASFSNYLFSRRLPPEKRDITNKYYDIELQMLPKNLNNLSENEILEKRLKIKGAVQIKLKQLLFGWKPIEYNNYKSLLYMITRSAPEYSVIQTIFNEIKMRDPHFVPETVFDFGSGIGSVLWASIAQWKNIKEYLAVDISNHMNDLSENIIKNSPTKFKNIFYRQYLPVSNYTYDLVVSAYSLIELPDAKNRLKVINKLWRKTNKYLIIVEQGTNAGFQVINEAREFIKHLTKSNKNKEKYFIFAPCPHEMSCPRFAEKSPCNFLSYYTSLSMLGSPKPSSELFSYIIFKKDERIASDSWYRLVRPTIVRSKHVRCRLCTSNGKLEDMVFTKKKHGKPLYMFAKATKWGDRLALQSIIKSASIESEEVQKGKFMKKETTKELYSNSPVNVNEMNKL